MSQTLWNLDVQNISKYIARCLHVGLRCLVSICRPPGHWEGHASKGGREGCMLQRGRHCMTCQTATEAMAKLRRVKSAQDSVEIQSNSTEKEWCLRRSNFHISNHFSRSNDEMGWQHLCREVIPSHFRQLFDSFGFCICAYVRGHVMFSFTTSSCYINFHMNSAFLPWKGFRKNGTPAKYA